MFKEKGKPIGAFILMVVIFIGSWYLAHLTGLMVFKSVASVIRFLAITTSLMGFQLIISTMTGTPFEFVDHGLQLSIIAFISVITLYGNNALGNYTNEDIFLALVLTLVSMGSTMYINVKEKREKAPVSQGWRLINFCLGIISIQTYIIVSIEQEIQVMELFIIFNSLILLCGYIYIDWMQYPEDSIFWYIMEDKLHILKQPQR